MTDKEQMKVYNDRMLRCLNYEVPWLQKWVSEANYSPLYSSLPFENVLPQLEKHEQSERRIESNHRDIKNAIKAARTILKFHEYLEKLIYQKESIITNE